VLGLINGFGTVALHGSEGFRAEGATIVCLFTDPLPELESSAWGRERVTLGLNEVLDWILGCRDPLMSVVDSYGVPYVSVESALAIGLLSELGLSRDALIDVSQWLRYRPKPPSDPPPSPGPLRLRPA
jgi:hypothetical protein